MSPKIKLSLVPVIMGLFAIAVMLVPVSSVYAVEDEEEEVVDSSLDGYRHSQIETKAGVAGVAVPAGGNAMRNILYKSTEYVLTFLAALAVLVIVISGILYISAGGEQDRVDSAKKWLMYGIIGLVIALLAYVIVYAVGAMLGLT